MPLAEQPPSPQRTAYLQTRRRASIPVYFASEEEKREMQAVARAQGFRNFSQWILHMVQTAAAGTVYPAGYVAGLENDVARYRAWVRQKDEEIHELRRDLRLAEQQRDDLRVVLAGLAERHPVPAAARRAAPGGA